MVEQWLAQHGYHGWTMLFNDVFHYCFNNVVQHWWSNKGCSSILFSPVLTTLEQACSLIATVIIVAQSHVDIQCFPWRGFMMRTLLVLFRSPKYVLGKMSNTINVCRTPSTFVAHHQRLSHTINVCCTSSTFVAHHQRLLHTINVCCTSSTFVAHHQRLLHTINVCCTPSMFVAHHRCLSHTINVCRTPSTFVAHHRRLSHASRNDTNPLKCYSYYIFCDVCEW